LTPGPLHPQIEALLAAQETAPEDDGPPSLEALRDGYLKLAVERGGAVEPVDAARDVVFGRADGGSVRARVYTPLNGVRVGGRLVWLHGGGWCLGDLEGFDRVCRSLANAGGFEVVSVDYRLAPESRYPAAVEDADAALRWAFERGGPVVVGGDSAGGTLATVAARHAAGELRAQVLVYPATDASMAGESYAAAEQPMLRASEMELSWAAYRGKARADDPDVSPLRADLTGLPPTLLVVAGVDVLRSDGEAYAEALRRAGVEVELSLYEDMTHGFLRWGGVVDRSRELIGELADYTAGRLRGARR
jgi:acetyl esterase